MNPQQQEKLENLREWTSILGIGLVVASLLLAVGIQLLRSWYRDRDGPADLSDEILDQMRDLHLEGDLSKEEFRSIKSQYRKPSSH